MKPFETLHKGDIVSKKLDYYYNPKGRDILSYGIATRVTPTGFVVIQDIHGNNSYMKPTEIDIINND